MMEKMMPQQNQNFCICKVKARMHGWNVKASSGVFYNVHLFRDGKRRSSCSCESITLCCHILAAMYAIDDVRFTTQAQANTTVLRKRARKRAYKTSGQKKPCVLDKALQPRPSRKRKVDQLNYMC